MNKLKKSSIIACGVLAIVALIVSCCVEWPKGVDPTRVCGNDRILQLTQRYKFVWQSIILVIGLQLWITCMIIEVVKTRKKWKDNIYPLIVVAIGMVVTLTSAIVFGNLSGRLSPDYISACQPHSFRQNWQQTCIDKGTVKFECTLGTRWKAVQSSLFPRMISILTYAMTSWVHWMIWRPLSSTKISNYFIVPVAVGFVAIMGFQAIQDASADWLDVFSGYAIGMLIAGIVMGEILPRLFPFIYENELPQYWDNKIPFLTYGRVGFDPDLKKPYGPAK